MDINPIHTNFPKKEDLEKLLEKEPEKIFSLVRSFFLEEFKKQENIPIFEILYRSLTKKEKRTDEEKKIQETVVSWLISCQQPPSFQELQRLYQLGEMEKVIEKSYSFYEKNYLRDFYLKKENYVLFQTLFLAIVFTEKFETISLELQNCKSFLQDWLIKNAQSETQVKIAKGDKSNYHPGFFYQ